MPYILGIDTGGTFTDGVLLNLRTKEIRTKAKAFTTREDLSIGIRQCINNMTDLNPYEIELVVLSTTLATNAIVEGRGCNVGLIQIGHESTDYLPTRDVVTVKGGHDIKGQPMEPLDEDAIRRAVVQFKGKVDTLAISGYLSIRNPEHEKRARDIVSEMWDVPVICAHQLSTALGFRERTVTACLNARLLPVVAELLEAVKCVLSEKKIRAKLMIVKGDGSLMNEQQAKEKPIETILSGPAASIIGATFLTGNQNALVLDMGGTTTDVALLDKGKPRLNPEGAVVGGWKTRVEAAEISTFGLGGDSYIRVTGDQKPKFGPERVLPLSAAAHRFPHLVDELSEVHADYELIGGQPVDCWMLVKQPKDYEALGDREKAIIQALSDGAHNIFALAKRVNLDPNLLPLKGLERSQVIGRISLTPTDLLHCTGKFRDWSFEAAAKGASIQAERMNKGLHDFLEQALSSIKEELCIAVLQSMVNRSGKNINLTKDNNAVNLFLESFFASSTNIGFRSALYLEYPIVAIGAPVSAYLPQVGEALHTQVFIPEHSEVANAVGAAAGKVIERAKALIKPGAAGGFVIHAAWGIEAFVNLDDAKAHAVAKSREIALDNAKKAGVENPTLEIEQDDVVGHTSSHGEIYLETQIEVTAVGNPCWVSDAFAS